MIFHPISPYDTAFQAKLEAIRPGVASNLPMAGSWPEAVGEQVIVTVLSYGCQSQNTRNIILGREAAKELPREWLLARIEPIAAQTLNLADPWEYRRLLELSFDLNTQLWRRFISQGASSISAEVREVAAEYAWAMEERRLHPITDAKWSIAVLDDQILMLAKRLTISPTVEKQRLHQRAGPIFEQMRQITTEHFQSHPEALAAIALLESQVAELAAIPSSNDLVADLKATVCKVCGCEICDCSPKAQLYCGTFLSRISTGRETVDKVFGLWAL